MAKVTAAMVKDLREKTGAGMMDCKKALVEADGDFDAAVENLRKAGIAKAAKKAGRATTEGKVVALLKDDVAVLAEILCETDFVAKNEKFNAFCDEVAARIANDYDVDGELGEEIAAAEKERIGELVTNIGENIQIRRVVRWQPHGQTAVYLHMGGKIGVLVDVAGEADAEFLNDLCMQIAAFNPTYVSPDDIPEAVIAKEKEIAAALPDMAGKPENIIDKILEGKLRKWYTEVCLTKQPWIRDDKQAVEKVAPKAEIKRFVRWQVGEEL